MNRERALKFAPVLARSIELAQLYPNRTFESIIVTAAKEHNIDEIPSDIMDAISYSLFQIAITNKLPGAPDAG